MRASWLGGMLLLAVCGATAHAALADRSRVNGSIEIGAGQQAGNVDTVNGAIRIGAKAVVGRASTVNGGITLGDDARAAALRTVNGAIRLQPGATVSGAIATVNGGLHLAPRSVVAGMARNVNGSIQLDAASVHGDVETTAGDVRLDNGALIGGGLTVRRDQSWFATWFPMFQHEPVIVVGPGCRIAGKLVFQRPVRLYVSDHAVIGPVSGARVLRFAGTAPAAAAE